MRKVVLIAGPPCAGKTTLAKALAAPGELVLDRDLIAQELGSPTRWGHAEHLAQQAEAVMRARIAAVARAEDVTAYVVRSVPRPGQRIALANELRATEVFLLNPGLEECMSRAARDGRPRGTTRAIRSWFADYRPCGVDRRPHERPVATSRSW
ncbi:AAA family ATPase [Amycolatopsis thermoflava]|uniref:AAA family ATPase n=1 Tax=Amycolatopsis thermoflava TaxID=84480 RepID=UPI003804363A